MVKPYGIASRRYYYFYQKSQALKADIINL
jgi:hypothetical protein